MIQKETAARACTSLITVSVHSCGYRHTTPCLPGRRGSPPTQAAAQSEQTQGTMVVCAGHRGLLMAWESREDSTSAWAPAPTRGTRRSPGPLWPFGAGTSGWEVSNSAFQVRNKQTKGTLDAHVSPRSGNTPGTGPSRGQCPRPSSGGAAGLDQAASQALLTQTWAGGASSSVAVLAAVLVPSGSRLEPSTRPLADQSSRNKAGTGTLRSQVSG